MDTISAKPISWKKRAEALEREVEALKLDRFVFAQLAADTPQFTNPMDVWAAKRARDRVLDNPQAWGGVFEHERRAKP